MAPYILTYIMKCIQFQNYVLHDFQLTQISAKLKICWRSHQIEDPAKHCFKNECDLMDINYWVSVVVNFMFHLQYCCMQLIFMWSSVKVLKSLMMYCFSWSEQMIIQEQIGLASSFQCLLDVEKIRLMK